MAAPRPARRFLLPLLPITPLIVGVVGLTMAAVLAFLGIAQLQEKSDGAASLRAQALSATLAARVVHASVEERPELIGRAARRAAAEILLVNQEGQLLVNESFGAPTNEEVKRMLREGTGEGRSALGRVRFASRALRPPFDDLSVLTFVAAASPPPGSIALVNAVAALTALLLSLAVAVTLTYVKDARDDLDYMRQRIVAMAALDGAPAGEPVPIRSIDQVGVLAAAFNMLVTRFAAAERSYRADLRQAAQIDHERATFLAGLSHELRTPLNAILGFSHVLESEVEGPLSENARESLQIINRSGAHLKTLIDDILDLSALETGQLKLSRGPVDVRALAEEVVREASATIWDKPLELEVSGQDGLYAFADARRVRQILTNLITNAIKATSRGSVTVHVEARGGFVAIIVRDTGAGISPEEMAAIFEAYRQAGDARSRRGGVGLGLSIAKRLVSMHGGTISLESRVGKGSTFTICLPRHRTGDSGPPAEFAERPPLTLSSRPPAPQRQRRRR